MDAVATSQPTKNAPERTSLAGAFVAPLAVVLVVLGSWLTKPPAREPLGAVADFSLTERSGRTLSRAELLGHPWVAGFVFTRCGGPCPVLSDGMKSLQAKLRRTDARIVSFSVDPSHDTAAILTSYARLHEAGDGWFFVTGDTGAITSLVYESFHLPVQRNENAPPSQLVTHSTRLVLVDREARIRGYYDGVLEKPDGELAVNAEEIDRLDHDLRALGNTSRLPLVNAALNATSGLFLLLGFFLIRRDLVRAHAACMLGALGVSAVFLGCYLYYHATYPSTPFPVAGPSHAVYLAVLIPHVVLAVFVVPLALATARLGLKGDWGRHRRLARIAFPLWIYVSTTGVAVYVLLYEIARP